MSTTPTPAPREAASTGAFLFVRSMKEQVAPEELGGLTAAAQLRIVRDRIHESGLTLDSIVWVVGSDAGTSEERLDLMRQMLAEHPIKYLFVPGAAYAQDSDDELMKHHVLLMMHGTHLIVCDGN